MIPSPPYLLLNKEKCLKNIARFTEKAQKHNLIFRPHFKTHQSIEVGEWYRKAGVTCITVSSFKMAEYFANAGWNDITVAFPVSTFDTEIINKLAEKISLNIIFSSPSNFISLNNQIKHKVGVYIELDTGQARSGLNPDNNREIALLVNLISQQPNIEFKGFITHAGHTYEAKSGSEVEIMHKKTLTTLTNLKLFWKESYPNISISYGDTPSFSICDDFWGIDEIRPGNFVFYDVTQSQIGSCTFDDIAVALICQVVDVYPTRNEAIIRGGAIHLSKDSLILPNGNKSFGLICLTDGKTWDNPIDGFYIEKISQEHGVIKSDDSNLISTIKTGQLVAILPVHSCLTVDTVGELYLSDGTRIVTMRERIR